MKRHSCLTSIPFIISGAFLLYAVIEAFYAMINPINEVETSL